MLGLHRSIGTYRNKVTRYIALNDFCRRKFIEGGLPADKVVVKPNFVDYPAPTAADRQGFLFVGRLSVEKGIGALAEAARHVPEVPIRIAGTGPEAHLLQNVPNATMLGALGATTSAVRWKPQLRSSCRVFGTKTFPARWSKPLPRGCR